MMPTSGQVLGACRNERRQRGDAHQIDSRGSAPGAGQPIAERPDRFGAVALGHRERAALKCYHGASNPTANSRGFSVIVFKMSCDGDAEYTH